jgi:hypothetical protein
MCSTLMGLLAGDRGMTVAHQFIAPPNGDPPWCLCEDPRCPGWAAYLTWISADAGGAPSRHVIGLHRQIVSILAALRRYYSDLTGTDVTYDEALALAAFEMNAGPRRVPGPAGLLEFAAGYAGLHGAEAGRSSDAAGEPGRPLRGKLSLEPVASCC